MSRDGWLPPGVESIDIPGNRPIDQEWEKLIEWLYDTGLHPSEIKEAVKEMHNVD